MKQENDRNDKLDSLIDEALTTYTPRAVRTGLEQRVFASIASAELAPSSRPHRWNWKLTGALAACVILLAVAIPMWTGSRRSQITAMSRVPSSRAESSPRARAALMPSTRPTQQIRSQQTRVAVLPLEQPQFGLPRPTKEALLMARFVAQEPELAATLVQSETDLDAPITIKPIPDNPTNTKPIEIKPITVEPIQISSLNPPN
jgi:hypothetical protein